MFYKTINEVITAELIIKKSRFISILMPVTQLQDVENALYDAKQKYPKANHYCFAYIIRQEDGSALERCSDDGEPSGTAGWPLLNVLKKRELENIMAIVVRYFGGTLLGTGGLVKAYTQAVQSALDETTTINMEYSQNLMVRFNYSHFGSFSNLFCNIMNQVTDIQYSDVVSLKIWIAVDKLDDFIKKVDQLTGGTATIKCLEKGFISHTIRS
jgi:uncharacterized YigZ family protein